MAATDTGHSFIQAISIAPLQVHYYSEALPTQHGYCGGVLLPKLVTASEGLAQGPYMVARAGLVAHTVSIAEFPFHISFSIYYYYITFNKQLHYMLVFYYCRTMFIWFAFCSTLATSKLGMMTMNFQWSNPHHLASQNSDHARHLHWHGN